MMSLVSKTVLDSYTENDPVFFFFKVRGLFSNRLQ